MLNDFYEENWALRKARRELTPAQVGYVISEAREKVAEGGNQSGKTWSGCVDFLSEALGDHPTVKPRLLPGEAWKGWWATTTYQLFAEQAWGHWKKLLLLPGEQLPMKPGQESWFIKGIGWHTKNPEQLAFLKLLGVDRKTIAEIYIKAYAQGRGEFQTAELNRLNLDEECPQDIYDEAQPRVLKRGGIISITCTPVLGVPWLEELRAQAKAGNPDVHHSRFDTRDNPGADPEFISKLVKKYATNPAKGNMRLAGFPVADEGKIYSDLIFDIDGRVVKPFAIPNDWTKYRCSDHGVHVVATLWFAVAPGRKKIVLYREYYGQDVDPSVRGNALNVLQLSMSDVWAGNSDSGGHQVVRRGERAYYWSGIDKATLGSGQETGQRLIDLWNNVGLCSKCGSWEGEEKRCDKCGGERLTIEVSAAMDNRLEPGIERVKELLDEKAPDGSPLFVVFDRCTHFQTERRGYGRQPVKQEREKDEGPNRPVKRADHALDCWRYAVLHGLEWQPPPDPPAPARGTLAAKLFERRKARAKK